MSTIRPSLNEEIWNQLTNLKIIKLSHFAGISLAHNYNFWGSLKYWKNRHYFTLGIAENFSF